MCVTSDVLFSYPFRFEQSLWIFYENCVKKKEEELFVSTITLSYCIQ
jgi:hypothetical protein